MPRFADNWVVDKCMFDYVAGGVCACCGFPHLFAPGGLEGMINAFSDLETDAATMELNAAKASPWPPDMRDQIWSDRLLLRFKMKKEMKGYRNFLEGVVKDGNDGGDDDGGGDGDDGGSGVVDDDDQDHDVSDAGEVDINDAIPILEKFCMNELSPRQIQGIFQLPRSELTEVLNSKYKICSAFAVVFCTVVEQVANFKVTGYPTDARSNSNGDNSEEIFEQNLKFKKVGRGFCVDIITSSGTINEKVLRMFLQRMVGLAGPTLLARAAKSSSSSSTSEGGGGGSGSDDDDGDVDGASSEVIESRGPSFRSDRRVVRLMIARYWADRLIEKYEEVKKMKDEANLRTIENAQVQ
eukprot:CAMPEP_0196132750 /NCGR_PEP_ID=MMETSP0910-20130528/2246_1 /TAXON_ID=49265 /ORGANISM="Thalassiosira rotula, Strain GSO102" /LENGTH=352 /DNA_ID=CAMNT_0041392387 /DNA_START=196 /DNA_END=1254 /DNA_ORIENTATION=-